MSTATTKEKPDYEIARDELREWFKTHGFTATINGGELCENQDKWRHRAYRVTIQNGKLQQTFDYSMGVGLTERPDPAEVLANICESAKAGEMSFEDFAAEFGYDEDSRAAEATWRKFAAYGERLAALSLTADEIEKMAELHQRL